ncbi:MAG TPA: TonB-dependent siderophore receptor [Pyrinomonadaceae bacterium]|nr:TonB-dependent siderophore receptor [Pyrinomonadaceae bacterium]
MLRLTAPSRLLLSLLFILFVGATLAGAQVVTTRSSIRGRVLDPNGAAVVGAKVVADAEGRGAHPSTTTGRDGEFSMPVEPGEYTLRVVAVGFSEASQTVRLSREESATVEVVLQVAGLDGSVTVQGDGGSYRTDAVASATKTLTPLRDVPQAITVVTKEQIQDQLMQSVGDVVRYTPGLSVHQGENNRDEVIFRGQDSSSSFFLDGVRDDVQYYRDLYNLERLETLKGPNAMIFGRGGGGGVINRVTKQADFSPLREFSLTGGSFYNRRVSGDFDQPLNDKLAFRLNGVYENSESFRRYVNLRRLGVNPTFTYAPDSRTRITLGYEFDRDRRVADRGVTSFGGRPADVSVSTYYGDPEDSRVRSNVQILSGTFERQFGRLNIHNRTTFGDYDRGYQNFVPGAVNASKTLVALTAYNNATRRKNLFSQTDLTYSVSTGRIKHTFLGGSELGRQLTNNFRNTGFFNNTTTSVLVPYDNPTINIPVTFRQSATDADNHLKTNLAATYAQDQIELSRNVQVVVGLRYDYFDLRFHNNRNDANLRRIDNLVSPRAGIVFKPATALSIYGSYGVSYLPSSGDQFSSLTTITEQVRPEKFRNYEAGVKWDARRYLSLTSAIYRLDRTNTRSVDPNNPAAIIQTGSQRTNGFEIELNGSVTHDWSIAGGYSYQNAFVTSATATAAAGKQVGQVPHDTLSVWNRYQLNPKLAVGLGVISRSDMFVAVDNTVIVPGYTRADAAVYYSFGEHWRLQCNIENLFDRRYFVNADSNTNISPGSPRAARVGLTARF